MAMRASFSRSAHKSMSVPGAARSGVPCAGAVGGGSAMTDRIHCLVLSRATSSTETLKPCWIAGYEPW